MRKRTTGFGAAADIGGVNCHGQPFALRNDEDNIIPPDTVYAAANIEPAYAKCHNAHNAPAAKPIARRHERYPGKTNAADPACADCDGEHRLKLPTVWCDTKTRRIVIQSKDQHTGPAPATLKKADGRAN